MLSMLFLPLVIRVSAYGLFLQQREAGAAVAVAPVVDPVTLFFVPFVDGEVLSHVVVTSAASGGLEEIRHGEKRWRKCVEKGEMWLVIYSRGVCWKWV